MINSINTFGCSWTAGPFGHPTDFPWPLLLADNLKDIQVNNWAREGTSISYQSYILDAFCQNIKKPNDIIIFQITTETRFSHWDANLHKNFDQMIKKWTSRNYCHYMLDTSINLGNITAGDLVTGYSWRVFPNNKKWKKEKNTFAKQYYKRVGISQSLFDFMMYLDYVIPKVDFIYFHRENINKKESNYSFIKNKYKNIPCVREDVFGVDEYKEYVIDDGEHLNIKGNNMVADFVLKNIEHLL